MTINWPHLIPSPEEQEMAGICARALDQYLHHKITPEEFEATMNYATLTCIDELACKDMPPKPRILADFEKDRLLNTWISKAPKDKAEIEARVYNEPSVVEYTERMNKVIAENVANARELERLMDYFRERNQVAHSICYKLYFDYPVTLGVGKTLIWHRRQL